MTKILLYSDDYEIAWIFHNPEERAKAFLALFNYFNGCEFYSDRGSFDSETDRSLYDKAVEGDAKAAENLLRNRRDYEYEGWQTIDNVHEFRA